MAIRFVFEVGKRYQNLSNITKRNVIKYHLFSWQESCSRSTATEKFWALQTDLYGAIDRLANYGQGKSIDSFKSPDYCLSIILDYLEIRIAYNGLYPASVRHRHSRELLYQSVYAGRKVNVFRYGEWVNKIFKANKRGDKSLRLNA